MRTIVHKQLNKSTQELDGDTWIGLGPRVALVEVLRKTDKGWKRYDFSEVLDFSEFIWKLINNFHNYTEVEKMWKRFGKAPE